MNSVTETNLFNFSGFNFCFELISYYLTTTHIVKDFKLTI